MIPQDKIQKILERLYERSIANEVNWLKTNRYQENDEYVVEFPESTISIKYCSPSIEPDNVVVRLTDKTGVTVASDVVYEQTQLWALCRNLYFEAERFVLGWDKILLDVERAIDSDQRVGLPARV